MSFGTVINCMDGRTQIPAQEFLKRRLEVDYIDTVAEAGPVRILAAEPESTLTESILSRVRISTDKHGSRAVAIVAQCPGIRVLGLWTDQTWSVTQVCAAQD